MYVCQYHVCGMVFLVSHMLYMLLRFANPSGHMCFRCMLFTLSSPMECFIPY